MTTYLAAESTNENPVELFRFSFGGFFWRYTSADEDFTTSDGETYVSEPLLRSGLGINQEANTNNISVTLAANNQVAEYFTRTGMPMRHIWLTVSRTHRAAGSEIAVMFTGVAAEAVFEDGAAQITFVPLRDAMARQIPFRLAGRLCSNALYDQRCLAEPESFRSSFTVSSINGLTLTVGGIEGLENGYFSGGYVFSAGLYQNVTVRDHIAPNKLVLMSNPGWAPGMQGYVYAGCDKRLSTCRQKFDNVQHFQGFPFFPLVDPFDGGVT